MRASRVGAAARGILAVLIITGCSGQTTGTTLSGQTTSTSDDGTSATDSPGTTQTPSTTTAADGAGDGAEGSGCTPGEGDLPDGEWYGETASLSAEKIVFDLACWFTGDAAAEAAAEDGQESPPPNDYYVRNSNTTIGTVAVGDDVSVVWYPQIGDPTSETTIAYDEWRRSLDDRGEPTLGIWIQVDDGLVDSIREQ